VDGSAADFYFGDAAYGARGDHGGSQGFPEPHFPAAGERGDGGAIRGWQLHDLRHRRKRGDYGTHRDSPLD
jgi:hypothetical protein